MVKGVTRRVIVVKSPDPRYFEEAIFIVKEDVSLSGVNAGDVLKEAQAVASGFVRGRAKKHKLWKRLPSLGYLAAGAAFAAIVMTLLGFLL